MPGCRSTKKLPSRKIRGRIANVASLWIGSPLSETVNVTSAAEHCWLGAPEVFCGVPPSLHPGTGPTPVTWPTSIPAIRTGDPGLTPLAFEKTAWTVYWLANGFANFVNPR